ncbi:3-oxoacyl-[acyl-carrier-protein] synthase, mitochondrial [Chionoecetes opilio]|uniref:3-oxoacyl-[acyl-carrier-protein] synthase n=1 Tax=Chionoecetes opilio TaxID=41210 RepID=A0A8J8WCU7_CHIOP|nr:3-oxoacyl-[acyl-carrier-protein] synthase, mitochondrial [Chionoecetes opilio]
MGCVRRVVVTGLGLVTPLGVGAPHTWLRLTAGRVATAALTDQHFAQLPCRVGARVPQGEGEGQLHLPAHFTASQLRTMTPATAYARVAAREALQDAGWHPESEEERERSGVAVGMGMVDLEDILATGAALKERYSRVSPYFVPRILTNMAAGQISMEHGLEGPNHSVSTACATGAHAVGDAFRFIRHGDAEVMVCGGAEACINPLALAGFCRLRALATSFNEMPEKASRPFDIRREGFVMGEGAGVMVLEELSHARARGATVYAEVLGYGATGDAHHYTAPREDGRGAVRAMTAALREAGVAPGEVGYINAHATSTPLGDAIEARAIREVFQGHADTVAVSSVKGALGHLLGAAGAVEAVLTAIACHAAFLPPTANLEEAEPGLGLDLVAGEGRAWLQDSPKRVALSNSFGFGGTNASLCLAACD